MLGVSRLIGAMSIPAIAPSTAANPQPSASIQLTRTPSSLLASPFRAAARIVKPRRVNRKKTKKASIAPSVTPITPIWSQPIVTPPTTTVPPENPLGKNCTCGDQIHAARALKTTSSPIVTMTTLRTGAPSTGRIAARSTAMPPTNERTIVATNAVQ
jgi:hypothetical protein